LIPFRHAKTGEGPTPARGGVEGIEERKTVSREWECANAWKTKEKVAGESFNLQYRDLMREVV